MLLRRGAVKRVTSPAGGSILITSAPRSREHACAVRPGQHACEVEHPDAVEWSLHHRIVADPGVGSERGTNGPGGAHGRWRR